VATNETDYSLLLGKLAAYAAANKQKNKLIEHSLQFLKACEIDGAAVFLILADPVVKEDFIDWTNVGSSQDHDVREALVTRRILAGYLPVCCLIKDKSTKAGWRALVDDTVVPDEYRDEFLEFASNEATIIASTFNGELSRQDSFMTALPWEDLSYPGLPMKPRRPGTIRIEVNILERTIRIVWAMVGWSRERSIPEEHITGDDLDDVLSQARFAFEALKHVDPPKQFVRGDRVEIWQIIPEGERRLLGSTDIETSPDNPQRVNMKAYEAAN
jgi:hypothetical protein